MNRRTSILARMRRWKSGAGRFVVGSAAVAYLSAGVAPCAMAATDDASSAVHEHVSPHEGHATHGQLDSAAHSQHGHQAHGGSAASHDAVPAVVEHGSERCPHCPHGGAAPAYDDAPVSCFAAEDLTNVAASHVKDALQPLSPLLGPAAFTLPPPLASPRAPPPLRVSTAPPIPLNVRHCVFLI